MALQPPKKVSRRKSKIVTLKTGSTAHGQNIMSMLEAKTTTDATITSVIGSAGSNDTEFKVAQTIREQTTTNNPAVAGEKRKRDDADDKELAEAVTPRKQRKMSQYSNPAGRTRSQLKILEQVS